MTVAGVFKGSRVVLLPFVEPGRDASGLITVTSAERARPFMHPIRPAAAEPAAAGLWAPRPVWQRAVGCVHTRPVAPLTRSHGAMPGRWWTPTTVESVQVMELLDWRRRVDAAKPGSELVALLANRPDVLAGRRSTVDDTAVGAFSHAAAVLDGVAARRRQLAAMAADEARDLALLSAEYPGVDQFLPAEVALALGIREVEAQNLLDRAHRMITVLPATLAALSSGVLNPEEAEAIVNATATADPEVAGRVEAAVVPTAAGRTYKQVFAACSYRLAKWDAPAMRRRQHRAVAERRMTRRALADGMSRLSATGTAEQIAAVWEALTLLADVAATPDDPRDTGNRRVDVLVDVCIDAVDRTRSGDLSASADPESGGSGTGTGSGQTTSTGSGAGTSSTRPRRRPQRRRTPRPSVQVVMPLSTLLGGDEPALLAGHGPIPGDRARLIAADADLRRLICEPLSGQVIDYGRTLYRPPEGLARLVRGRDRTCCFPGCEQPAGRSDLDHVIAARPDPATGKPTHGTTCYCNLCVLCRHHHLLKDGTGGFTLTRSADGSYTWTTALGRTVTRGPTDALGAGDHTLNGQPTMRRSGSDVDDASTGNAFPERAGQPDRPTSVAPTSDAADRSDENTGLTAAVTDRTPEREDRALEQKIWDRDCARYRSLPDDDPPEAGRRPPNPVNGATDGSATARPTAQRRADDQPDDAPF